MKKLIVFLVIIIAIISAHLVSTDKNLLKPKTKKTYVSEQQDIELDGDIIMCGTQASGVLIELSRAVFLITKAAITRVNNYACGEKGCLNKVERTDQYTKKAKIKEKIEKCIEQFEQMLESLNALIAALDE